MTVAQEEATVLRLRTYKSWVLPAGVLHNRKQWYYTKT